MFIFLNLIFALCLTSVFVVEIQFSFKNVCILSESNIDCSNRQISKVVSELPPWVTLLKLNKNSLTDLPYFSPNNLTSLNLAHNKIAYILKENLINLKNLENLDLSYNDLKELVADIFFPLSRLVNLNLNHNNISRIENGSFNGLRNLADLKLSRNKISVLNKDLFKQLTFLRNLELNRNQLNEIGGLSFMGLESLYSLKLRQSNVDDLADGAFYGLSNLRELHLDFNKLIRISKGWLYGLESLVYLNVSNNKIRDLNHGWESCLYLKELDISNNRIESIQKDTFQHLVNLKLLKLNNNRISYIEHEVFDCVPALQILDLSNNFLSWIIENAEKAFSSLKQLIKLSLINNKISHISRHAYSGLINLNELDLAGNTISSIEQNAFADIPQLKKLTLNSTSLICDCMLKWLIPWLNETSVQINANYLSCVYPPHLKKKSIQSLSSKELICQNNEQIKPELIIEPEARISLVGSNVTLRCGAVSSTNSDMTFIWKMNNHFLDNVIKRYESVQNEKIVQYCDLILSNVSTANDGIYQCIVSNIYGVTYSKSVQLSIFEFPTFVKTPSNVVVKVGGIARLECLATGNPVPEISWQKDGGLIIPAAQEKRMKIMSHDDPFFIQNVKFIDAGVYTCNARNEAGINSANATFTVLGAPKIIKPMEDKEIRYGEAAVMECIAEGSPKPSITWTKDHKPMKLSPRHLLTADDQLLIIMNTVLNDSGLYECELSNGLGTERGKSFLFVSSGDYNRKEEYEIVVGIIMITLVLGVVITSAVWVIIIYVTRRNRRKIKVPLSLIDSKSENSSRSSKDSGTGDSTNRSYVDLILATVGNGNQTTIMQVNRSESPSSIQESKLPLLSTFHPVAMENSLYLKDSQYASRHLRPKTAMPSLHFSSGNKSTTATHTQTIFCTCPKSCEDNIQCTCSENTSACKNTSTENVACDYFTNGSMMKHNSYVVNQCDVISAAERNVSSCCSDVTKRPCSIPLPFHAAAHSVSAGCCRHQPNSYLCLYVPPSQHGNVPQSNV